MQAEQAAAANIGLPWDVRLATASDIESPIILRFSPRPQKIANYVSLRYSFYKWLTQSAKDYDIVLLRHSVHDIGEALFLSGRSNVFLVHHTLEISELKGLRGIRGQVLSALESIIGTAAVRRSWGLVCVTQEIAAEQISRFGKHSRKLPCFIYPNGTDLKASPCADQRSGEDCHRFLLVAAGLPSWHGVDLLVDQVQSSRHNVFLHFVGPFDPDSVGVSRNDNRFVFHGEKDFNDIRQIAAGCDLGLSALALERKGMKDACPLKAREYLKLGLPVYGGYRDSGLPEGFMFYKRGAANLEEIIEFSQVMKRSSRSAVAAAARPWIDKRTLVRNLYDSLTDWWEVLNG